MMLRILEALLLFLTDASEPVQGVVPMPPSPVPLDRVHKPQVEHTALNIDDDLSVIPQLLHLLTDPDFHNPNAARNREIRTNMKFEPTAPDFTMLLICGIPSNKNTGTLSGFTAIQEDKKFDRKHIAHGRLLPHHLQPFHDPKDPELTKRAEKAAKHYKKNLTYSGADDYKDAGIADFNLNKILTCDSEAALSRIFPLLLCLAHIWSLSSVHSCKEISHTIFLAGKKLLPSAWEDTQTALFCIKISPDLELARQLGPINVNSESQMLDTDMFAIENSVKLKPLPHIRNSTGLGPPTAPEGCKGIYMLGSKFYPSASLIAMFFKLLSFLTVKGWEMYLSTLSVAPDWPLPQSPDEPCKDHVLGGLAPALIFQNIVLQGPGNALESTSATTLILGQCSLSFNSNMLFTAISLCIAVGIVNFEIGAGPPTVERGGINLKAIFKQSDPMAEKFWTLLVGPANVSDETANMHLLLLKDAWMTRLHKAEPGEVKLTTPWTHLALPELLTRGVMNEGAKIKQRIHVYHCYAKKFATNPADQITKVAATFIMPSTSMDEPIKYLVPRTYFDNVPNANRTVTVDLRKLPAPLPRVPLAADLRRLPRIDAVP
ncbi:hypothetical protein DXG01_000395 [Tephrocybe rancida]|nr:hypothetical protein DXG01_000395 [Tephrocybe rancida]